MKDLVNEFIGFPIKLHTKKTSEKEVADDEDEEAYKEEEEVYNPILKEVD